MTKEERWNRHYAEERAMVEWFKHNRKLLRRGEMLPERVERFRKLQEKAGCLVRVNQFLYTDEANTHRDKLGMHTILLLGSGGREHALAWKIAQSPRVLRLFIAPGNAGTSLVGENVPLRADDFDAIRDFVLRNQVTMVVVGPEDPLVKGIANYFQADAELCKIPVIGPSSEGARLEGSKDFAKQFMMRHNIPTARYLSVSASNIDEGRAFLKSLQRTD